ncbi:MAG: metallophosphoesterase family protein [Azospirillum sp.]|nr:metallophosphoesterase family protein [Azospirillum sp.]
MKVAVFSDLHREFIREAWRHRPSMIDDDPDFPVGRGRLDADVVVLAGDIDVGVAGIEWAKRTFPQDVVYVAGNHEFYDREFKATLAACRQAAAGSNVSFLENDEVRFGDVRFIGCTFWTDFELVGREDATRASAMKAASNIMSDYRVIGFDDGASGIRRLRPEDTRTVNAVSKAYLHERLAEPFEGRTIVVTHHLPFFASVSRRFAESHRDRLIFASFASPMDDLAHEEIAPDLWIHGHTHDSKLYEIGNVAVACNPRGYPRGSRHGADFDPNFILEIKGPRDVVKLDADAPRDTGSKPLPAFKR